MLLRRIVLLYIVLLLCRIVFYCYNYALIGPLGCLLYTSPSPRDS